MNSFTRSQRRALHAAVIASLMAGGGSLQAQEQPASANNSQDEVVNIVRGADAKADSFKILRSGNKAEINRYVTKVYRLKHANPYEILPYIRGLATLEKGTVSTAWVENLDAKPGDPDHFGWLQVNVPDFQIPSIDQAIASYDVPNFVSQTGDIKFSYRTKYRSAVEVADFIRATTLSGDGSIKGDPATNTIYVGDSPSDFRRDLAQIQFYDVPVPQIDLEVSILELTTVDQTSLGLDWDAWKTALSGKADFSSVSKNDQPATGGEFNSSSRSFDGLLSIDATALARFLNYLVDKGKAKVRAKTNINVGNGTTATLSSSTQIPEFQYTFNKDQNKSLLNERPGTAADPSSEGLSITVLPIIAMNAARMDIDVAVRSPVAIGKDGSPIYSTQHTNSSLTLEQGQTYKLGGIRRGVDTKETKGVPLLKDIPVIKFLFSNETRLIRETELYVFLKPTWSTPKLPANDSIRRDTAGQAETVKDLLKANPNITLSHEDAALLEQYFQTKEEQK